MRFAFQPMELSRKYKEARPFYCGNKLLGPRETPPQSLGLAEARGDVPDRQMACGCSGGAEDQRVFHRRAPRSYTEPA